MDPLVKETGEPYDYAGDDPVNATDPNGLCWSLAPGIYGPCLPPPPGVPYEGSFTPEEIAAHPDVLEGLNPQDVLDRLGGVPDGFAVRPGQSESLGDGPGWVLDTREGGGISIRWSPGSARAGHPSTPYWRVSGGRYGKSGRINAGRWPEGPPEFTKTGGGTADGKSDTDPNEPVCDASYATGGGHATLVGCFGATRDPFDEGADDDPDPFEIGYSQPAECAFLSEPF